MACGAKGKAELSRELASNDIHSLPDELLLEILCQLPSKSAVQCKFICKHWAALISSPIFIGLFIADKKRKQLPDIYTLLHRHYHSTSKKYMWRGLKMNLSGTLGNPENLSSYLLSKKKNGTNFHVLASCNDLVLMYGTSNGRYSIDYYIFNAQTKQRLLLSRFPSFYDGDNSCAITCDPWYHSYGDKIIIDATYRYSIVVLSAYINSQMMMKAHLFSNANKNYTGEWREVLLSVPKHVNLRGSAVAFLFNGKLYFDCSSFIIGFDPYDEDGNNSGVFKCHLVDCPSQTLDGSRQFQEYDGQLHMFVNRTYNGLRMWRLKDYKTSKWLLLHNIQKEHLILQNELISRYADMSLIGAHPTNPNSVYVVYGVCIVLCDLSARTLEIASHIKVEHAYFMKGLSILPIWPTPLPMLN